MGFMEAAENSFAEPKGQMEKPIFGLFLIEPLAGLCVTTLQDGRDRAYPVWSGTSGSSSRPCPGGSDALPKLVRIA